MFHFVYLIHIYVDRELFEVLFYEQYVTQWSCSSNDIYFLLYDDRFLSFKTIVICINYQ